MSEKPTNMVEGRWWGYDGKFKTKEEIEKLRAEAKAREEAERLRRLEHPDEEYSW